MTQQLPSTPDMRTQRQKIIDARDWARKHPVESNKLRHLSGQAREKYIASLKEEGLERATLEAVAKHKEAAKQQYQDWKTDVQKQYPSPKYDVQFTYHDAMITERPLYGPPQPQPPQQTFDWHAEDLTPKQFESMYGPFASSLDLPTGTRITHTRRTAQGFEMKYLPASSYDVGKPWGVDAKDIAQLKVENKLFTAHLAENYMKGTWITGQQYTPKQFSRLSGLDDIPKDSIILAYKHSPKGYAYEYIAKSDWEASPSYIREDREPTFWEIPLHEHFLMEMTKPRIKGYGDSDSKILGGPIGGGVLTRTMGSMIMLGEATVGEVEEHIVGKRTIRSDLMTPEELAVTYGVMGASIVGSIALFKFGPKIVQRFSHSSIGQGFKHSRPAKMIETIKGKLPSWRGSSADIWLAKHSETYYRLGSMARGEVAQKALIPKSANLAELRWSEAYWRMIQAPRTGGVTIGRSPITTKGLQTYTFGWVLKGGQLVPKFRPQRATEVVETHAKDWAKYWQPDRGLTPFVSQQQVTRMGVHPHYVGGRATATIGSQIGVSPLLLGIGLTTKLRIQPKLQPEEWQPTLAFQREKLKTITLEKTEQKQRQTIISVPKLLGLHQEPKKNIVGSRPKLKEKQASFLISVTGLNQLLETEQKQEQKLVQSPILMQTAIPQTLPPTIISPTYQPPRIPHWVDLDSNLGRSRRRGVGTQWFLKHHPVPSASQVAQQIFGKTRRGPTTSVGDFIMGRLKR